uniref:Uncharacterized protein n=1 Tax=Zea mays TaxID=4577 RepID=A0A804MD36_MAIZE
MLDLMIAIRYHEARRGEQGPPLRLLLRQAAAAEGGGEEGQGRGGGTLGYRNFIKQMTNIHVRTSNISCGRKQWAMKAGNLGDREAHKDTTSWLVLISNVHHHLVSDPDNRLGGLTDGFGLGMNMLLGGDKEDDGGSRKSHGKSGNRKKHMKNSKKRTRH